MDLSKLPKLSQTPPPPESPDIEQTSPAQNPAAAPRFERDYEMIPRTPGLGFEVWLSAAIGIILMLVGRSFLFVAVATLSGETYHTGVNWIAGPNQGQEVGYYELQGYSGWTDTAIFLFGLAMVFEAVALAVAFGRGSPRRGVIWLALFVAILATAFNLGVAVMLLSTDLLPLISLLCVAFGVYIAAYEWRLLQSISPSLRAQKSPGRGEDVRGSGGG